jgi:hypothetical protein
MESSGAGLVDSPKMSPVEPFVKSLVVQGFCVCLGGGPVIIE